MIKLLAFDTATDACSVALKVGDEVLLDHQLAPQQHGQLVLPAIDALLAQAGMRVQELDALAFGRGPGSFTGVRIAAAVAQGIAFGAGLPVIAVSTLQALAQQALRVHATEACLALLDARMAEVYSAMFTNNAHGIMQLAGEEQVHAPEDAIVNLPAGGIPVAMAGSGADRYVERLLAAAAAPEPVHIEGLLPHAMDIIQIAEHELSAGQTVCASDALPVYLRNRVALTEQQRARGETL